MKYLIISVVLIIGFGIFTISRIWKETKDVDIVIATKADLPNHQLIFKSGDGIYSFKHRNTGELLYFNIEDQLYHFVGMGNVHNIEYIEYKNMTMLELRKLLDTLYELEGKLGYREKKI